MPAKLVKGVSFLELLTLLFIGLKITGCIDWSWIEVFMPIWGPFAVVGTFILAGWLGYVVIAAIEAVSKFVDRRNRR